VPHDAVANKKWIQREGRALSAVIDPWSAPRDWQRRVPLDSSKHRIILRSRWKWIEAAHDLLPTARKYEKNG